MHIMVYISFLLPALADFLTNQQTIFFLLISGCKIESFANLWGIRHYRMDQVCIVSSKTNLIERVSIICDILFWGLWCLSKGNNCICYGPVAVSLVPQTTVMHWKCLPTFLNSTMWRQQAYARVEFVMHWTGLRTSTKSTMTSTGLSFLYINFPTEVPQQHYLTPKGLCQGWACYALNMFS